ncbi:uncharacterized protein LOC124166575 isoform X1 [Ischnura elegans]|uniref:uncharacterized protein LOC124166575 isoform X1 n=1 Tax=Ischnura elegans TaxID=197161 RepID=UPI001ED8A371|nr:uncharacterized protein LOC124166575 isoform X1 [Ischnura elegans]
MGNSLLTCCQNERIKKAESTSSEGRKKSKSVDTIKRVSSSYDLLRRADATREFPRDPWEQWPGGGILVVYATRHGVLDQVESALREMAANETETSEPKEKKNKPKRHSKEDQTEMTHKKAQ